MRIPGPARPQTTIPPGNARAVVLGASMAGLLAARVLSAHFGRVTLIERDRLPDNVDQRKGVPQGRHLHALLVRGERIVSRLFPGLTDELVDAGAEWIDLPGDVLWFQDGGYKCRQPTGVRVIFMSRPLLECRVRRRVLAMPNVTCLSDCDIEGLVAQADKSRVTGVTVRRRSDGPPVETLEADLVIDATGRGSKSPRWLEALGYEPPPESVVTVGLGYTTRVYRRDDDLLPHAKGVYTMPAPPHGKRGGGLFPIEDGRWLVTQQGWLGDHAPPDENGFLEYARSLPCPELYKVISRAEPLSGFVTHGVPSNLRRHYERLARFPGGYLVVGDAVCSFNPVYGQGMSVAAMEAEALDECLAAGLHGRRGLARAFFRRAARAIDVPWSLATGEDFRFPEVQGHKPFGTDMVNRYVSRFHKVTFTDPAATKTFFEILTLTRPPRALFGPSVLAKLVRSCFGRR